jgi:CRP-like cAMP-binding protein
VSTRNLSTPRSGELTNEAVLSALAASELFGGLDDGECRSLAKECRLRRYSSGDQIFARGDGGAAMYLVGRGAVTLSVASADGGEVVLAVLRPPQTFGELTLIDERPRIATATAREASLLIVIPRVAVMRLIRTEPGFAVGMLSALARLVRRVDDNLADMSLLDLRGRVVKFLAAAADRPSAPNAAGAAVAVDIKLTQTDLARLLGGSRQQVNRIIVDLEREGAIQRTGARITLIHRERLGIYA